MSKGLFDVIKKGEDVRKIAQAVASGMDPTDIQEALEDLGFDVEVDTIDWGNHFGQIVIEGGENETGVIITLAIKSVELGFDTINVGQEEPSRKPSDVLKKAEDLRDQLNGMMDSLDDSVTRDQIYEQLRVAWEASRSVAKALKEPSKP